jgi:hypothetical protein
MVWLAPRLAPAALDPQPREPPAKGPQEQPRERGGGAGQVPKSSLWRADTVEVGATLPVICGNARQHQDAARNRDCM